jgi:hypothetical protein
MCKYCEFSGESYRESMKSFYNGLISYILQTKGYWNIQDFMMHGYCGDSDSRHITRLMDDLRDIMDCEHNISQ